MLKLRKLLVAFSFIVGTCSITNTLLAQTAEVSTQTVAQAVDALEQALSIATTPAEVAAAKSKALAAGVPLATVNDAIATAALSTSAGNTASKLGGSTTSSSPSIPNGGTNIGDTGSTYN